MNPRLAACDAFPAWRQLSFGDGGGLSEAPGNRPTETDDSGNAAAASACYSAVIATRKGAAELSAEMKSKVWIGTSGRGFSQTKCISRIW